MRLKKLFSVLFALGLITGLHAQEIPNHSFEKWLKYSYKEGDYMMPEHWVTNDVLTRRFNPAYKGVSVTRLEEPHTGDYALKMEVVIDGGDTVNGGIYSTGSLDSLLKVIYRRTNAGFSWKQKVSTFTGYYIFSSNHNDSAFVGITFTKWNTQIHKRDTLVNTTMQIGQNASSYIQFTVPLKYRVETEPPDTAFIVIGIQGSNHHPAHRGTMFIIDDLAFTGTLPIKKP